jgi:putative SOS response-associated peptidase YedK
LTDSAWVARKESRDDSRHQAFRVDCAQRLVLDLPISYNIAPTHKILAIRYNPDTEQRTLDALGWGLIPNWARDPKIAYKTINARAETVDTAPSYRRAFEKRRCLSPADGFTSGSQLAG